MKSDNEAAIWYDQSVRHRRPRSREVSSRYLSPSATPTHDIGVSSPAQCPPTLRQKAIISARKNNRSLDDPTGFIRGLWPSSMTSSPSSTNNKNQGTLADHLKYDRLKDLLESRKEDDVGSGDGFNLTRQKSFSELCRIEGLDNKEKIINAKENHRPIGGSMRYTKKNWIPGKSSLSSTSTSSSSSSSVSSSTNTSSSNLNSGPGRLSVDENTLYRSIRKKHTSMENCDLEYESGDSFRETAINSLAKPISSRKSSAVDSTHRRLRRGTSDSDIQVPGVGLLSDASSSPKVKKSMINSAIKRANSLTTYGSVSSRWALSPGRTGSPPMSVESMERPVSFTTTKQTNPSRHNKGHVEKLFNLGFDLFKTKKSASPLSSNLVPLGPGTAESVHQMRLMHNRFVQWRFANVRANAVNMVIHKQMEGNILRAWGSLTKLRHSVMLKKLHLQKEKLKLKLDRIMLSQIKPLEAWAAMERQHSSAISMTKDCLHAVICKLPLVEGAKVDPHLASLALRHALDLTAFFKITTATLSPSVEESVELLSRLAQTVAQEKLLLEECHELLQKIHLLEVHERSLECCKMQLISTNIRLQTSATKKWEN